MAGQKSFIVNRLGREDLSELMSEEEIAQLTDKDMRWIASKMGEAYCESGAFWDNAELFAQMVLDEKMKGEGNALRP